MENKKRHNKNVEDEIVLTEEQEDLLWYMIAKSRDQEGGKFIFHEEAWKIYR